MSRPEQELYDKMELNKTDFAGDVLLIDKEGSGEIVLENGLIKDCRDFSTAAYLSLFGGNKRDKSGQTNETWWGNLISGTKKNEKLVSSFYAIVTGLPLNSMNIKKAVAAAKDDLEWFVDEGIADEIDAAIEATNAKTVQLAVDIRKNRSSIMKDNYSFQWQGGY